MNEPLLNILVFVVAVVVGYSIGRIQSWWKRGGNISIKSRIDIDED